MKKIGRLSKIEKGWQLQYWNQEDRGYEVVKTSTTYKHFSSTKEALEFVKTNGIQLEDVQRDETEASSFPCPSCDKKGIRSWMTKKKDGTYLCGKCGDSSSSRENAWNRDE